jgi:hypothetical protein
MLFEDNHVDAGACEQETQHNARRSAPGDAASRFDCLSHLDSFIDPPWNIDKRARSCTGVAVRWRVSGKGGDRPAVILRRAFNATM